MTKNRTLKLLSNYLFQLFLNIYIYIYIFQLLKIKDLKDHK